MDLNGTRIMVTGATGLLGAGVVRLLIERGGVDVRVFARNRQKTEMFAQWQQCPTFRLFVRGKRFPFWTTN